MVPISLNTELSITNFIAVFGNYWTG